MLIHRIGDVTFTGHDCKSKKATTRPDKGKNQESARDRVMFWVCKDKAKRH
ncbi:Uncharacterised protein [Vibrio cholerae]|nr:Uncharacterised protein [Vibrio cholerae]